MIFFSLIHVVEHQSPKPARRVPQTTGGQAARAAASPAISRTAPARAMMSKSNTNMPGMDPAALNELNKQVTQLQVTVDGLERERDFYFAKLRDVEILVQNLMEGSEVDAESELGKFAKQVQAILYSTEEGFEIPQDENQAPAAADEVATY